jgi:hypothetical protein
LLPAEGAEGVGFTVIEVVAVELVHPATVTLSEYVPPAAVVTLVIMGF